MNLKMISVLFLLMSFCSGYVNSQTQESESLFICVNPNARLWSSPNDVNQLARGAYTIPVRTKLAFTGDVIQMNKEGPQGVGEYWLKFRIVEYYEHEMYSPHMTDLLSEQTHTIDKSTGKRVVVIKPGFTGYIAKWQVERSFKRLSGTPATDSIDERYLPYYGTYVVQNASFKTDSKEPITLRFGDLVVYRNSYYQHGEIYHCFGVIQSSQKDIDKGEVFYLSEEKVTESIVLIETPSELPEFDFEPGSSYMYLSDFEEHIEGRRNYIERGDILLAVREVTKDYLSDDSKNKVYRFQIQKILPAFKNKEKYKDGLFPENSKRGEVGEYIDLIIIPFAERYYKRIK